MSRILKRSVVPLAVALLFGVFHLGIVFLMERKIVNPSFSPQTIFGIAAGMALSYFVASRLQSCTEAAISAKLRYNALFDGNVEPILVLDPETGAVIDANPAAVAFYGYPRDRLLSMNIAQINPIREDKIRKNLRNAANRTKTRFLFRHRLADGTERPVEVYSSASDAGDRTLIYAIVHDVTDRLRMEKELAVLNERLESQVDQRTQELREVLSSLEREISGRRILEKELRLARDESERANLAKSEFLSWASHELRTPLNAVIGMTNLALDTELDEEQRSYMESVLWSGNRLLRLVNDLLDLSRVEEGRMILQEDAFSIVDSFERVLQDNRAAAEEKGLRLSLRTEGTIPSAMTGDAFRVEQILDNLVDNAIRFTDVGSVSVTLSVSLREGDDRTADVSFVVADTGIGIPTEDLPHIFDPYVRSTPPGGRGGIGLGLPVSRRIAKLLGGDVSAQSDDSGSTFRVDFPLKIADVPCAAGEENRSPEADGAIGGETLRVLLAEDEPMNREVALGMLRNTSWTIDIAENGEEAVRSFESGDYDLILMDVKMPVFDGLEATRRIRAIENERASSKRTPIVAMTAYAMTGDRERCLAAGMDDYISKPVRRDEILRVAARAFSDGGSAGPNQWSGSGLSSIARLAGNDPTLMTPILRAFIEVAPTHIAALRKSVESGDAAGTEEAAHRLKGQSSYFDDRTASEIAARLEADAREGRMENALSDSRVLEAAMRSLLVLARGFLERSEA